MQINGSILNQYPPPSIKQLKRNHVMNLLCFTPRFTRAAFRIGKASDVSEATLCAFRSKAMAMPNIQIGCYTVAGGETTGTRSIPPINTISIPSCNNLAQSETDGLTVSQSSIFDEAIWLTRRFVRLEGDALCV